MIMANFLSHHLLTTLSLLLLLLPLPLFAAAASGKEDFNYNYVDSLNPKTHKLYEETLTHFHFYFHDIVSGKHPTAIRLVNPPANFSTATGFGAVNMFDDPLTESPNIFSKLIGRAQGLYGEASQEEVALLVAMNMVFVEGKYNGSYITVLGRNSIFNEIRELPVVGGSGLFRFARGYAQARTFFFDPNTGDAILEYNVYVMHY